MTKLLSLALILFAAISKCISEDSKNIYVSVNLKILGNLKNACFNRLNYKLSENLQKFADNL